MKTRILLLALFQFLTLQLFSQVWSPQAEGSLPSNYSVMNVSIVNDQVAWAIALDYSQWTFPIPSTHLLKVLRTTDGGANWEVKDFTQATGRMTLGIFALDENTALFSTTNFQNAFGIYRTTNGGDTWTQVQGGATGAGRVMFFNDMEGVSFLPGNGIARSNNGGASWTVLTPNVNYPPFLSGEDHINTPTNWDIFGDTIWIGTTKGRVYRSTNKGLNWTVHQATISNNYIISIAFSDSKNGLATIGDFNNPPLKLIKTIDGGESWIEISNDDHLTEVLAIPCSKAFLGVAFYDSLTVFSKNLGTSWTTLDSTRVVFGPAFLSPGLGWASNVEGTGPNPALFKWDGGLLDGRIYVSQAASGANDGSTWADAYTDLKVALDSAEAGDEIWVAEGTYLPGSDATATFLIDKNLKLYGSFAGTECNLSERDIVLHPTILSGDVNGDDVVDDFVTNRGDNVMNVVRIQSNINNSTIINGFVVQGGHADGSTNNHQQRGGGFYSLGVPIIQQCSFLQNYAFRAGGGIHQDQGPSPGIKMEDCHFESNRASNGAGLYMWSTPFEISGCVFQNNKTFDGEFQANGGGASIALSSGTIRTCIFKGNEAFEYSGGLGFWFPPGSNSLNVSVSGCDFENNTAGLSGGGLGFAAFGNAGNFMIDSCDFFQNTAMGGSGFSVDLRGPNTEFTLTNSHFSENQTTAYYATASVYTFDAGTGTATIDNCTFENNHSVNAGGLDIGSLEAGDNFDFYITNCIFRNNVADVLGGGFDIFGVKGSTPNFTIENCLIEGNSAGERAAGFWVDVVSSEFQATMRNCRISGNESPRGSGIDIFQFDVGVPPYTFPENATLRLENCLISENASDFGVIVIDSFPDVRFLNSTIASNTGGGLHLSYLSGVTLQNTILSNPGYLEYEAITNDVSATSNGGNLVLDNSLDAVLSDKDKKGLAPDFEPGTYEPSASSPLVNGGINEGVTATDDLAGNPRIQHDIVDIGAYESMFTPVREEIAGEVALSPNPVAGFLNIHLSETTALTFNISIFDTQGRLATSFLNAGLQKLNVGGLVPGVYSVKVLDGERVYVGKFIKQ